MIDFVADEWIDDTSVNECFLNLTYRDESVRGIPRTENWPSLTSELKDLVIRFRMLPEHSGLRFVPKAEKSKRQRIAGNWWTCVEAEEFPTLSRFFEEVRITCVPGTRPPRHATSLGCRWTGLDKKEISRVIKKKCAKALEYRSSLGELAVWLLFYAEGWPPAGRIHGGISDRSVIESIRQAAHGSHTAFDRIWWGRHLLSGEASVWEVSM